MEWTAQMMSCQTESHTFNSEVVDESGEKVASILKPDIARLIAASPDMARSCIALIEWHAHKGDAPEMLDEAVQLAIKSLTKAGVLEGGN